MRITTTRTGGKQLKGCGALLFGLPFCIPGLVLFVVALLMNANAQRYQSWERATAQLIPPKPEAETESVANAEADFDGDESSGDLAGLRYRYEWEGRSYPGAKATVAFEMRDSDDHTLDELKRQWHEGASVPVWVNPANPQDSILLKPSGSYLVLFLMIFAFSHGLLGGVIITSTLLEMWRSSQLRRLRNAYPGAPWLWRSDWARGVVRAESGSGWIAWIIAAVVWWGIAGWLAVMKLLSPGEPLWSKGVCLALLAIGALLVWIAFRLWLGQARRRRLLLYLPEKGLIFGKRATIGAKGVPQGSPTAPVQLELVVRSATRGEARAPLTATQGDEKGKPIYWEATLDLPDRDVGTNDEGRGWEARCEDRTGFGKIIATFLLPVQSSR